MTLEEIKNELKVFESVKLDEESHTYTALNKNNEIVQAKISMTSLLHKYVREFDQEYEAERYAIKHNLNKEDVLKDWKYEGDLAAFKGTAIHNYLEYLFKGLPTFHYDINKAIKILGKDVIAEKWEKLTYLANKFYELTRELIIPIACELKIFDEETGVAGAVDLLAYHIPSKEIIIIDYKSSKEIQQQNVYNEFMLKPLQYLPDINYYHYSLQLSGYQYIIEKNTRLKLRKNHYIVWINEKNDEAKIIVTQNLLNEAKWIIENERFV